MAANLNLNELAISTDGIVVVELDVEVIVLE
jgi:hypothetical protein